MDKQRFEIEEVMDSLATISDIIFKRLQTMECNQCQPCGEVFMRALNVLREAGNVNRGEGTTRVGRE